MGPVVWQQDFVGNSHRFNWWCYRDSRCI